MRSGNKIGASRRDATRASVCLTELRRTVLHSVSQNNPAYDLASI